MATPDERPPSLELPLTSLTIALSFRVIPLKLGDPSIKAKTLFPDGGHYRRVPLYDYVPTTAHIDQLYCMHMLDT